MMRYFDVDMECPLEPVNKLKDPSQELRVITYMPDG
jgi:hypothetical protein